jgi:hypothetical protein
MFLAPDFISLTPLAVLAEYLNFVRSVEEKKNESRTTYHVQLP